MLSNLRSIPIQGHITDSSGNVLRNVQVTIKQQTPSGSVVVDVASSDDSGYFITNPISNGIYDVYESGIKLSRIVHSNGNSNFQCFQASLDNYNQSIIKNFANSADDYDLNSYKSFLQIEPQDLNINQFGHLFPIYDKDISEDPESDNNSYPNEIYNIANFFNLSSVSRITTSRFDIEYFLPITSTSNTFKRIRWAGVPGIKFYEDSKIVLPLDYYSIVANNSKNIVPKTIGFEQGEITNGIDFELGTGTITDTVSDGNLTTLTGTLFVGDILKIRFINEVYQQAVWYGIVTKILYSDKKVIFLEKWRSSRFVSGIEADFTGKYIQKIFAFDGMFSNIMDIGQEVNQLFTIVENFSSQNQETELYNYINQV